MFVYLKCPCGRSLRAQRSSERTTIQCWDCKSEIKVPRFRSADGPKPIERIRGAMASEWAETAAGVILLALAVAAMVAIPGIGGWLGLALMVCAAMVYLRRIEEVGRLEQDSSGSDRAPASWKGGLGKLVLAVALVAGFVVPIWLVDGSRAERYVDPVLPPPWPLIVMLAIWVLLPLVAFALVARDAEGRLGVDLAMATAWRRRFSMIAVLLLPLVVFAVVEAGVLGVLFWTDGLATVLLDLFPLAQGHRLEAHMVLQDRTIADYRPSDVLQVYGTGLLRGATLLGAVPLSFLRGPEPRIILMVYGPFRSEGYLLARLGITAVAMLALFGALAMQSNLLGRIGLSSPRSEPDYDEDESDEAVITQRANPPSSTRAALGTEPLVTARAAIESGVTAPSALPPPSASD